MESNQLLLFILGMYNDAVRDCHTIVILTRVQYNPFMNGFGFIRMVDIQFFYFFQLPSKLYQNVRTTI